MTTIYSSTDRLATFAVLKDESGVYHESFCGDEPIAYKPGMFAPEVVSALADDMNTAGVDADTIHEILLQLGF